MIYLCILLSIALFIVIIKNIYDNKKREQEIQNLTTYLTKVQDNFELPEMEQIAEGSLSILQSEIYKVVALLGQSYSLEKKQKKYMADMLSDISHQIKTPITAISVMTDLLSQTKLGEELRLEYVSKIDTQISKITWLVKNILTLSQIEANVIELKKERVNVNELLSTIHDTFEIMAEVKMIELEFCCDENVYVICDEHWTIEAISNVVKNCIEHTGENGHVKIIVKQDNIATNIHVIDDGCGIEVAHLPHIFERFYKANEENTNSIGIGLAMAKQIIMKQEGNISVTSEVGVGSNFYIKFYTSTYNNSYS